MHLLKSAAANFILWMAGVMDGIANWLTAKGIAMRDKTRTSTTEPDERTWDRAAVESGAMKMSEYVEKWGRE